MRRIGSILLAVGVVALAVVYGTGFVAIESASGLGILGLVAVALTGGGAIALLPGREPADQRGLTSR